MSDTVPGIRFVRCPKCLKILTEFAEVPVYKCGGCGTVLRAKNRTGTKEHVTVGSLSNNSHSLSEDNGSFSNGSATLPKHAYSSKVDDTAENAPPSTHDVSLNAKGESSENGEAGIENGESELNIQRPTDQFTSKSSGLVLERQPEESTEVKSETNLNEDMEKPLEPSSQGHDSPSSSNKMEEYSEFTSQSVSLDENVIGQFHIGHDTNLRGSPVSSHAYYGSASSTDEDRRNRVPQKYLLLSKRTFRQKKVLDSIDDKEKEVEADELRNTKMVTDVETGANAHELPQRLNEGFGQAMNGSFDLKRRKSFSRNAQGRDVSFGSEDFKSVQNWMGTGSDAEASSPLSEDSLSHLNGNPSAKFRYPEYSRSRILRKVDELRDELHGLFRNSAQGKEAPQSKYRLSRSALSTQPHHSCLHCHHVGCCAHNVCCHHAPKAVNKDSNLPSHHRNAQQENDPENLQHKEKKKTVKSYCRPIMGGAPFVICYKCWRLLQLPADFLISQKKLHKLRCGTCSEILVFSYRRRTLTNSQTPVETQHPPSEVDSSADATIGLEASVAPLNDFAQGDPISFSEDYGLSFVRSYSSDAEAVLHVSRNSSDPSESRGGKNAKDSHLHRLMGYDSASELLFQTGGFDEGYQSTEPSTPHFYRPLEEDGMGYGLDTAGRNSPGSPEIQEEDESPERLRTRSPEIQEEDESPERLRTRRRGLPPLPGLLKKGIRELTHGLENVKLKAHSNG